MSSNKEIQNVINDVALMVWNIDYIVTYDPKYSDNSISFPEFYSQINGISCQLKLKLTSPNTQIYFKTDNFRPRSDQSRHFRYRLSFIDANGKHHHHCIQEGWSNLTVEYIPLDTFNDYFRDNAGVKVYCEVDILTTVNKIYDNPFGHFEAFIETGKLSDLTLSAGGKDFRVHKLVLAARSPVFCEMFENRKRLEQISFPSMASHVAKVMLKHIYTGCIPSMSEYAFLLYVAADTFQLNQLKSLCGNALVILLDVNSFWRVLRVARRCISTCLKEKLVKFVIENYAKVMQMEIYRKSIHVQNLLLELEQYKLFNFCECGMCSSLSANTKCAVKEIALLVWNIKKSEIQRQVDAQVTKDTRGENLTIVSPNFHTNISYIGFKFKIGLTFPNILITIGRDFNFIRLYGETIHFRYRFFFLDVNGQKLHYFEHEAWNIHSVKYISMETFGKYFRDNGHVIKVICEVDVLSTANLVDDFGQFLETGKLSDMTLSVGGKDFRVHKFVLASRSPVFAAMFEHADSKEVMEGRISIEDMSSDVCQVMLKHIYTGSIPSMSEYAFDLFLVADKYQLNKLKSVCAYALGILVDVDSFCRVLLISDCCNDPVLKTRCLEFFNKTKFSKFFKIIKTEGWKQVESNKDLMRHVTEYMPRTWKDQKWFQPAQFIGDEIC